MEFINEFVCYSNQQITLNSSTDLLNVESPFISITSANPGCYIGGFETGIESDKSYLLFLINRTAQPIIIKHLNSGTPAEHQINVYNYLDYTLEANSYCILLRDNDKYLLK